MSQYVFPGFTPFLEEAARQIGCPEAADKARGDSTLSAIANLCAQAEAAGPDHSPEVMAKAFEFFQNLQVAHKAAALMLDAVNQSLGLGASSGPAASAPTRCEGPAAVDKSLARDDSRDEAASRLQRSKKSNRKRK